MQYRNFIRNRFTVREVVVSPTPLTADVTMEARLEPSPAALRIADLPGDHTGCCGTMTLAENTGLEDAVASELQAFRDALKAEVAERSRTATAKEKK